MASVRHDTSTIETEQGATSATTAVGQPITLMRNLTNDRAIRSTTGLDAKMTIGIQLRLRVVDRDDQTRAVGP